MISFSLRAVVCVWVVVVVCVWICGVVVCELGEGACQPSFMYTSACVFVLCCVCVCVCYLNFYLKPVCDTV